MVPTPMDVAANWAAWLPGLVAIALVLIAVGLVIADVVRGRVD